MLSLKDSVCERLEKLLEASKIDNKKTGFIIGNTAKQKITKSYFIPQRSTPIMNTTGVIVYSEKDAIEIAQLVDGKVDYVLVDAEKKIADTDSRLGEPGNIERAVRENINLSRLWTFKGNDLSVEAADAFLARLFDYEITGIGGKNISIIGCGNLGSKLALKLVERGANVYINRRNTDLMKKIASTLNSIKPVHTTSSIKFYESNELDCSDSDVIIGTTQGQPVIKSSMIHNLSSSAILLDIGKGSISRNAVLKANKKGIKVFRLDISCAMAGVITKLFMQDELFEHSFGRRKVNGVYYVSGGMMGRHGDIVVDSISSPKEIYGIADGAGDFLTTKLSSNKNSR